MSLAVARELESNGVVHIREFLSESDLTPIRSRLSELHAGFNQLPQTINKKSDANSGAEIREISHLVRQSTVFSESSVYKKCLELAQQIFGRSPRYGHDEAIFKSPGGRPVDWHQDQTYSKYDKDKQCVSIWIPLQDTNKDNGGMEYVLDQKGGLLEHRLTEPDSFMYRISEDQLKDAATVSPDMKAGDICVHTPLCIHRSHPNNGTDVRIAWVLQFNKYGPLRFLRLNNLKHYV